MNHSNPLVFEAAPSEYEKITMSTTLNHIGTLEKENILGVSREVDVLSNLKRAYKKVEMGQNDINEINNYQKENFKNLDNFEQCLHHCKFNHYAPMTGGSIIETPSTNRVGFKTCYKKFETTSEWLKNKKTNIEQKNSDLKVAEKRKENLKEEVGPLEKINAGPGYDFIRQVDSVKAPGTVQPDMDKKTRMRDNFNRLSNQRIDMNQEIIDKKKYLGMGSLSLLPTLQHFLGERASGKNYADSFPIDDVFTKIQEAKFKIPKTSNTSI